MIIYIISTHNGKPNNTLLTIDYCIKDIWYHNFIFTYLRLLFNDFDDDILGIYILQKYASLLALNLLLALVKS